MDALELNVSRFHVTKIIPHSTQNVAAQIIVKKLPSTGQVLLCICSDDCAYEYSQGTYTIQHTPPTPQTRLVLSCFFWSCLVLSSPSSSTTVRACHVSCDVDVVIEISTVSVRAVEDLDPVHDM